MENVLIISSNKAASDSLSVFMRDSFQCSVSTSDTAQQAKVILSSNQSYELAMINMPLSDESGIELAEFITQNTPAACIVLIKSEHYEKIAGRADKNDIILISRPFNRQILYQVVKAVDTSLRRSWSLYEETVRLERKIGEIQLIDKAKFQLMQYREMTEEEAHRYIEQYAMKNRKKKTIAASEIIDKINEQYL